VPEAGAPRWLVLATRQIAARPAFAVLQVSALAVGLLALVLLVLLRTDLISSWRQATPPDAPNRFVINLQPEQGEAFQAALAAAGVQRYDWYPMIRGRLVAINGKPVTPTASPTTAPAPGRPRVQPQPRARCRRTTSWWPAAGPDEADGLRWKKAWPRRWAEAGRQLRFDIAGPASAGAHHQPAQGGLGLDAGELLRDVPACAMPDVPATYISAFRAPDHAGLRQRAGRDFPNITNVDVSASIGQVQRVLDQVIRAVEFLFGFTLVAGLVVLFAAVTPRAKRAREFAIMRAVGAGSRLLAPGAAGRTAGRGRAGRPAGQRGRRGGGLAAGALRVRVHLDPRPGCRWPVRWRALLALAAGWWGLREVLRRPVLETPRLNGSVVKNAFRP
jgi:putative ABC transport system permease protein